MMFGIGKGMRVYAVYINPKHPAPHETAEFVPEHASMWAFLFHAFWCFYHKLWWQGLAVMAAWVVFVAGGEQIGLSMLSVGAIELAIRIYVAFEGNSWRQDRLRKQGYILSDIAVGDTELAAKHRFYQRWLDQVPAARIG